MRPTDLIIHQDALVREMEYQPARLAGSLIKTQRVQSEQIQFLQENFRAPQDETKSDFRNRLLSCLSDPQSCHTKIIQGNDGPLAVIAYRLKREDRLEISVFRVSAGALDSTLARYLVFQTVINATQEFRRKLIVVTDDYLAEEVISALLENGFVKIDSMWVRSSILAVEKAQTLRSRLHKIGRHIPFAKEYFHKIATIISSGVEDEKRSALLEVEKSLWPTKIIDLGIPAFVIPIQPKWAKDLFDSELASQTLFGSNPGLIFRSENVYYRSSQQKILEAPARILWYVSEGSGNFQGVKSIKACSYLDEVLIDTPKNLYSRFRRLGVFTWDDVYNIAKHNIDQEIMAFRFSKTELFDDPISLSDLRQIWLEDTGVQFNPITSRKISSELFFRLYKIGIGDSYA